MFSLKNITRAALLSAAAANTNGDLLSMGTDAVAGSEVGANVIDRAADMVNNAMQQGSASGHGGIFVPEIPDALKEAMAAAGDAAAELKEGFDMPDLGLDETLQSVMDFESKLFGEEDDAKLLAYLTELKGAEQGHAGEVKAAVDKLEEYRRTATGTGMMGKEETDRAVLIAEIFTAMLASSPVAMVAEAIKALKASDEAPGIAELEQLKDMMVGGLTNAEIGSLQSSDGDVFVDAGAGAQPAPVLAVAPAPASTDAEFCAERKLTTEVAPRIVRAVQKLNLCRRALPILEHEHLGEMKVLKTVTRAELVSAGMRIGDAHRLLAAINKQPAN